MAKEGQPCTKCERTEEDGAVFGSRWDRRGTPVKQSRRSRCKDCDSPRKAVEKIPVAERPCTGCGKKEVDGAEFGWRWDRNRSAYYRRSRCNKCENKYAKSRHKTAREVEEPPVPLHKKPCTGCGETEEGGAIFRWYWDYRCTPARRVRASECRECSSARSKAWREANVAVHRRQSRIRAKQNRAKRAGAEGTFTLGDIERTYVVQGGLCYYCENPLESEFHVDHKQPLSRGGSNWPKNLCCACPPCNISKGTKTEEEFWVYLEEVGQESWSDAMKRTEAQR